MSNTNQEFAELMCKMEEQKRTPYWLRNSLNSRVYESLMKVIPYYTTEEKNHLPALVNIFSCLTRRFDDNKNRYRILRDFCSDDAFEIEQLISRLNSCMDDFLYEQWTAEPIYSLENFAFIASYYLPLP